MKIDLKKRTKIIKHHRTLDVRLKMKFSKYADDSA